MPKSIIGQPFRVSIISGIEKLYASDGYFTISVEVFCLTVPKNTVGEPFSHSLFSGIEKVWIRGRGKCPDSPSKISCLTVPKNAVREPFSLSLSLDI